MPLIELVLQLSNYTRKSGRIPCGAVISGVEELMYPIEEAAYADTCEEIEGGLLSLLLRGMRLVEAW